MSWNDLFSELLRLLFAHSRITQVTINCWFVSLKRESGRSVFTKSVRGVSNWRSFNLGNYVAHHSLEGCEGVLLVWAWRGFGVCRLWWRQFWAGRKGRWWNGSSWFLWLLVLHVPVHETSLYIRGELGRKLGMEGLESVYSDWLFVAQDKVLRDSKSLMG